MLRGTTTILIAAATLVLGRGAVATAQELKAGDTLDQTTWERAKDLLPPEILVHYQKGEYINPIVEWSVDNYTNPEDFLAGSKANEGRFDVGEEGHIIDKATGKQPPFILGFPFPTIDPQDPKAGIKVLWNHFYRTWYFGDARNQSQLNWINSHALERRTDVDVAFKYHDGVPEKSRLENPQNFGVQFLTVVKSPADLHGTASLSWRYRDPDKRDSTWTYVPALRRVRAISPANRSDGFLGSDMSQDDGPFFDGKPEDFTWKLIGEKDQLRLVDALSLQGKSNHVWLPHQGWRVIWDDIAFIGYMDPNWKGAGWAPRSGALAKRAHWVLEGRPKDKYYLYGRLELYLDKHTYQGSWARKFDWKDELLNTYQVMAYTPKKVTRPDGQVDYVQGSNMAFQCAESVKRNQATVAGIKSDPKSIFDSHVEFEANMFDVNSLSRYGK